jgi:hypothetical protein
MSEQGIEQRLTPELVAVAINGGMLDASLDALRECIRTRQEVIAKNKAGSMLPGDRFLTQNISPRKWEGVEVEWTGRRDGRVWLVCEIVHDQDARKVQNYSLPGEVPVLFKQVKLRESHIGTWTRHQASGVL